MEEIFITNIHIHKVRHLENIEIPLSDTERKHLILTGKNGVGKTSVLEELSKIIQQYSSSPDLPDFYQIEFSAIPLGLELNSIPSYKNYLDVGLPYQNKFYSSFRKKEFISTFFRARRSYEKYTTVRKIEKVDLEKTYNIEEKVSSLFLQYLISLKADLAFAQVENDMKTAEKIEGWFNNFEKFLQQIFEDDKLLLAFDRQKYAFNLILNNGTKTNLNTLSDGYASILNIITELILRMERQDILQAYNIQGIAIIDEIETHLHPELQEKILPFLTSFFPKIQFIVSTHSPIVMSSLENAVVFDLGTKVRVEDAYQMSYVASLQNYFRLNKHFSEVMEEKMDRYEALSSLGANMNDEESDEFIELNKEFTKLSPLFSGNMYLRFIDAKQKLYKPA